MKLVFEVDKHSLLELTRNMNVALANSVQAGAKALDKVIDFVGRECDLYVPRDTGALAEAQYKKRAVVSGDIVRAEIGYGGPNDRVNLRTGTMVSSYMFYVHEDLYKYHPTGQAKFLEGPVRASPPIMMSLLHWEIKASLSIKRG